MGLEALLDTQILSVVGNTGDILELQADGTYAPVAPSSSGVGGSTGSVDNAILRADGTGGATLQNSAWIIADNYTASPNNTVNHASIQATGTTSNVSVSIVPKGDGAFMLQVPDGTTAGGNARGAQAIDFQVFRSSATQVASGARATSFGAYNTVTGADALCGNFNSTVSGQGAFNWARTASITGNYSAAFGESITASGTHSFAGGYQVTLLAAYASGFGATNRVRSTATHSQVRGRNAFAESYSEMADSSGVFATFGDCQHSTVVMRGKTTDATPTELYLDGSSARLVIPGEFTANRTYHCRVLVTGIKSDGSAIAAYERRVVCKCISGTSTLVDSQTIGTDYEDDAGTDVSITVDDTTDTLRVNVTGIASETWRWNAIIDFSKLGAGT